MLWPMRDGGSTVIEGGATTADSGLTLLTAAASANSAGSWVELIATTLYEGASLLVDVGETAITDTIAHYLIDIGIGAASSEIVLVEGIPATQARTAGDYFANVHSYSFPLRVPTGSRISARVACSTASKDIDVAARILGQGLVGPAPYNRCTSYGVVSASSTGTLVDPGGSSNTKVLTEIVASTTNPCRALVVGKAADQLAASYSSGDYLYDITAGPSSNEIVIVPNLWSRQSGLEVWFFGSNGPFPCDIPAGTRLGIDMQSEVSNASDRPTRIVLFGLD